MCVRRKISNLKALRLELMDEKSLTQTFTAEEYTLLPAHTHSHAHYKI